MTEENPLERGDGPHVSSQRRRPKLPAPVDDRSSDEGPEESGSGRDDTVSKTSTFGTNESYYSDIERDPSSPSNANMVWRYLAYNFVLRR